MPHLASQREVRHPGSDTVTSLMTKLIHAHNQPEQRRRPKDQLPHARLHDLRHIHATTLLLSRGAGPRCRGPSRAR
jgi:hypothetical protein